METRVLACDPKRPDPGVLAEAAHVLRAGGLVAFPTETVYGLGGLALDERAVSRIFAAKGRPKGHPLIAHVEGEKAARALAREWPEAASRLARAFWPGPLTLVVRRAAHVPPAVAGGADTIAVRAPAHPVARALIVAVGAPVAAPSANRYQQISATAAAHVLKSLGGAIELLLDGGPCTAGIESTVVDLTGDVPRVLRPGALDLAALRAVLPDIVAARGEAPAEGAPRASPGMDARHYAPRARLVIADTWHEAQRAALGCASAGAKVGLVLHSTRDPLALSLEHAAPRILVRRLPEDAAGYARALFSTLHELDDEKVDVIVVENVPDDDAWWAVADRLKRGATPVSP